MSSTQIERPSTGSQSSRLAGVEGLRAFAALSVLLFHVAAFDTRIGSKFLPHPAIHFAAAMRFGVTLFFVLSGFLLWRPFAVAVLRGRPLPSIRAYVRNRALRILPAYWVILLLTAFVLGTALRHYVSDPGRMTNPGQLLANLLLIQGYFNSTLQTGIGPAWSLCVEAVFYVALPFMAFAAARLAVARRPRLRSRAMAALVPAFALLLLGLATRIALAYHVQGADLILGVKLKQSFLGTADMFSFGMAAAVLTVLVADGHVRPPRGTRLALAGVAAALFATIVAAPPESLSPIHATDKWELIAALGSGLLVLSCMLPIGHRGAGVKLLERRPLVLLGLCSYSVYLWHTPVIFLLQRWRIAGYNTVTTMGCMVLVLAITLVLSSATYLLVERPALGLKRRMTRIEPIPAQPVEAEVTAAA